ncbi:hypothetical protein CoNPh14_CDS0004 [Staphylococcus phage S-CoN_Ph14]|nr:hypothetical protein CoNPh14_CDS0004 [Staphylococcus phage S-CoN_Ph14]
MTQNYSNNFGKNQPLIVIRNEYKNFGKINPDTSTEIALQSRVKMRFLF